MPGGQLFSGQNPIRRLTTRQLSRIFHLYVHPVFWSKSECYFLIISLPQHIRGTLQASSDPLLQVQAFFTSNSRSQALQ